MEFKEGDKFGEELRKLEAPNADLEIDKDMRETAKEHIETLVKENMAINRGAYLLKELVENMGMKEWTTVGTAMEDLTAKDEVDKLAEEIQPGYLHKNPEAIWELGGILKSFLDAGVLPRDMQLGRAIDALHKKKEDNLNFLRTAPRFKD